MSKQWKSIVETQLRAWAVPSMSVAIVKGTQVIALESFGYENVTTQEVATPDTRYQVGSNTKAFTALACAILVDQDMLQWDAPIRQYLPWIQFAHPYLTEHVSVRDLLSHRVGLADHDVCWIEGAATRRGLVEKLKEMQPCAPFRSGWNYHNVCYVALGVLIETLSGESWEAFVAKNILEPLGMNRTTFYTDLTLQQEHHATPYRIAQDGISFEEVAYYKDAQENAACGMGCAYGPAGSMISTARDMAKWMQFNLDKGRCNGVQLVSQENMQAIFTPCTFVDTPWMMPCPEIDFQSYALGWFTQTYQGYTMAHHNGNMNGFTSLLTLLPQEEFGIMLLTNAEYTHAVYAATLALIDDYLSLPAGDWSNRYHAYAQKQGEGRRAFMKALQGEQQPETKPSNPLEAFAGTYHSKCYGDMVLCAGKTGLSLQYHQSVYDCVHFHYDVFTLSNPQNVLHGLNITFCTEESGIISHFEMPIAMNPNVDDEKFYRTDAT